MMLLEVLHWVANEVVEPLNPRMEQSTQYHHLPLELEQRLVDMKSTELFQG
jgi:hypothetical protein